MLADDALVLSSSGGGLGPSQPFSLGIAQSLGPHSVCGNYDGFGGADYDGGDGDNLEHKHRAMPVVWRDLDGTGRPRGVTRRRELGALALHVRLRFLLDSEMAVVRIIDRSY